MQEATSKVMAEGGGKYERSSSMPLPNTKKGFHDDLDVESSIDTLINKNGW